MTKQHNLICVNINFKTQKRRQKTIGKTMAWVQTDTHTWGGVKAISMISQQFSLASKHLAAGNINKNLYNVGSTQKDHVLSQK
jgi:hypothetical protein